MEASVLDSTHVTIRLRSQALCDSANARWSAPLPLGVLAAGNHTVAVVFTMDRPDSGVTVHRERSRSASRTRRIPCLRHHHRRRPRFRSLAS